MLIAVAHHDAPTREALSRILLDQAGHRIVWSAADGREVLTRCRLERPDLLLLDLALSVEGKTGQIPRTIREIRKMSSCTILLVTDSVEIHAAEVFEALGEGALDAVRFVKEKTGELYGEKELVKKLWTVGKLIGKGKSKETDDLSPVRTRDPLPPLIAVGASTGGPKALGAILGALPADLGMAVVVVLHLEKQFSAGMADWLNNQCALDVLVAHEGDRPRRNAVLIASTNDHMILGRDLALHYTGEPRHYPYRPSVDEFFTSLDKHWPRRDVAILLTGMGRDGGVGMAALRKSGWHTIAQDEKTSIVYGMPGTAVELGGAVEILPVEAIAAAIVKSLKGSANL